MKISGYILLVICLVAVTLVVDFALLTILKKHFTVKPLCIVGHGAVTVQLPPAITGRSFTIKNLGDGDIELSGTAMYKKKIRDDGSIEIIPIGDDQ